MSKYVVDASVVLYLLREGVEASIGHELVAPTLLRSQVLEALYRAVRRGELTEEAGLDRLARFARMKIRFLGDKVLRRKAWDVADELGWASTRDAESIALTQLQAEASREVLARARGIRRRPVEAPRRPPTPCRAPPPEPPAAPSRPRAEAGYACGTKWNPSPARRM